MVYFTNAQVCAEVLTCALSWVLIVSRRLQQESVFDSYRAGAHDRGFSPMIGSPRPHRLCRRNASHKSAISRDQTNIRSTARSQDLCPVRKRSRLVDGEAALRGNDGSFITPSETGGILVCLVALCQPVSWRPSISQHDTLVLPLWPLPVPK